MIKKIIVLLMCMCFGAASGCALNLRDMSVEQKIGQMMCLDFRMWAVKSTQKPVTQINDEIIRVIQKYHIGSVILFSENFQSPSQSKKLIYDLQKAAKDAGNPSLLICVDQEGGTVERFSFNRSRLKNNKDIGESANPEGSAFEKGQTIGRELRDLGINCNLAPVVDINSNPRNPVINVRSFGNNASIVSRCGVKFMEGLHSQGIVATAKHFPGHGDTDVDSHLGLPRINKSLPDLENLELKPFKAMINSGVDIIMSAHIELPNIENRTIISKKDGRRIFVPATLSRTILTDILRNKLNFNGVIITDAMNMRAISDNIGESEAAQMAISAGADMICMPATIRRLSDCAKLDDIFNTLKRAVKNKEISISQINDSVRRILKLKKKYNIM